MKSYQLVFIFFCFSISIQAQSYFEKIHPSVWTSFKGDKSDFFIVMKEQANISAAQYINTKEEKGEYVFNTLSKTAERTQQEIQAFLKIKNTPFRSLWITNAIYVPKGDKTLIQELAQRDDVSEIVNNPTSHFSLPPAENSFNSTLQTRGAEQVAWGVKRIKADSVWLLGYQGQGVIIAGEDTGYDWTHPALKPKYRGWNGTTADHNYNWYDGIHADTSKKGNPCGYDIKYPCDDGSHGTHTMGTMIGSNDTLITGVAPYAKWIGARNMDRGDGSLQSYVDCFQFFLAPTDTLGKNPLPKKAPHVINNSWYCSTGEGCNSSNFNILESAVNACRAAGIVIVVSAGNSGSACSTVTGPPAFFSKSFSVGATRSDDTIANFSSRGPVTIDGSGRMKPNISAPGVGILSTIPNNNFSSAFSGTSMAGPHVAGVVALMISANPALAGQVDTIERIIELTAKPMTTTQNCGSIQGTQVPNHTYGFGRIDALAAVKKGLLFRVLSTDDIKSQIKVYPNPFSSEITFHTEGVSATEWQLSIFNINGQLMYVSHFNSSIFNVDLQRLTRGVYFYQLKSDRNTLSGKLIKQ